MESLTLGTYRRRGGVGGEYMYMCTHTHTHIYIYMFFWSQAWQPTCWVWRIPNSCLENRHGQRNLAGYSPWGHRVRHDWTTKHIHMCAQSHSRMCSVTFTRVLTHSVLSDCFATPWTVAPRLLCPWGFPSQENWSGFPFPPPEDLPGPGIDPISPALAGGFFTTWDTWERFTSFPYVEAM